MSRRNTPEKREIEPDVRYQSVEVQSLINRIMKDGKKSVATTLVYDALDIASQKSNKPAMEIFHQAMNNVKPVMEVRPRRVGGATYQVPMEVPALRAFALATRWIISAARSRGGKDFSQKLAGEFLDAAANTGSAVRKREETHKMAEANRAFSHYRM